MLRINRSRQGRVGCSKNRAKFECLLTKLRSNHIMKFTTIWMLTHDWNHYTVTESYRFNFLIWWFLSVSSCIFLLTPQRCLSIRKFRNEIVADEEVGILFSRHAPNLFWHRMPTTKASKTYKNDKYCRKIRMHRFTSHHSRISYNCYAYTEFSFSFSEKVFVR